jgi:hypothetical protein
MCRRDGKGSYNDLLVEINFSFGYYMRLSEDLQKWRAERPDEWTMDRFINEAMRLEAEVKKFTSTNKQSTPCTCTNSCVATIYVCKDCGGRVNSKR